MLEGINGPERVREYNLDVLRRALFQVRRGTRRELTALTGMSTVTLGGLLRELMEAGEVEEAPPEPSLGGRPVHIYCYRPESLLGLFVQAQYAGGDCLLHLGVVDRFGQVIYRETREGKPLGKEETRALFLELLQSFQPVGAIVAGLPGVGFDGYFHAVQSSHVISLEALTALAEEKGLSLVIENDINLATLGHARARGIGPEESLLYYYVMKECYGGSGVFLKGGIYRGKGRFAGEMPQSVYGVNWQQAGTDNPAEVVENLLRVLLPNLCLLAPEQVVVASDYITGAFVPEKQEAKGILGEVGKKISAIIGATHCPTLALTGGFQEDFTRGMCHVLMESMAPGTEEKRRQGI